MCLCFYSIGVFEEYHFYACIYKHIRLHKGLQFQMRCILKKNYLGLKQEKVVQKRKKSFL